MEHNNNEEITEVPPHLKRVYDANAKAKDALKRTRIIEAENEQLRTELLEVKRALVDRNTTIAMRDDTIATMQAEIDGLQENDEDMQQLVLQANANATTAAARTTGIINLLIEAFGAGAGVQQCDSCLHDTSLPRYACAGPNGGHLSCLLCRSTNRCPLCRAEFL